MLKILVVIALLFNTAVSAQTDEAIEANARLLNQHVVLSVLLAIYYCENEAWPEDRAILKTRWEKEPVPLPVEPEWRLLGSEELEFIVTNEIFFRTPEGFIPHAHAFETINLPPDCTGGNIKLNANTNIGGDA